MNSDTTMPGTKQRITKVFTYMQQQCVLRRVVSFALHRSAPNRGVFRNHVQCAGRSEVS